MVGRPSRRSESRWEALKEVREWSVDPSRVPGVVGSGRETIPEVRSVQEALTKVREWSGVSPGGP